MLVSLLEVCWKYNKDLMQTYIKVMLHFLGNCVALMSIYSIESCFFYKTLVGNAKFPVLYEERWKIFAWVEKKRVLLCQDFFCWSLLWMIYNHVFLFFVPKLPSFGLHVKIIVFNYLLGYASSGNGKACWVKCLMMMWIYCHVWIRDIQVDCNCGLNSGLNLWGIKTNTRPFSPLGLLTHTSNKSLHSSMKHMQE